MRHILLYRRVVIALSIVLGWVGRAQAYDDYRGNLASGQSWCVQTGADGCIDRICFGADTVAFFLSGEHRGPSFYIDNGDVVQIGSWQRETDGTYKACLVDVVCRLTYTQWQSMPAITVTLVNEGHVSWQPRRAGLMLGVDTYMARYPEWLKKFFPTLMRNEPTHFWGYMQAPSGKVLGLVCPQPVASWSVNYNLGYQDPPPHWFMGHRIESLNLDLLNALPLPDRHPQHLWQLQAGDSLTWTLAFFPASTNREVLTAVSEAGLPILDMPVTTTVAGGTVSFEVVGQAPVVTVTDEKGHPLPVVVKARYGTRTQLAVTLTEVGTYNVSARCGDKETAGVLTAHAAWGKVLADARSAAWRYKQKPTSHAESWYGFYSAFLAARYFPEPELDTRLNDRFELLFGLLHDTLKMEPRYYASRIQNTSTTIGLLVDRYEAYGHRSDIERAARLADWMIAHWQRADGAYVNRHIIYTSVIYVAKSVLELYEAERELGRTDALWAERAHRHYESARRAIDQLVAAQGNFETEGEMTFEDGMISCSALQIGYLALLQTDRERREHYTRALLNILNSHDCLTQLVVPDGRRRGGTMRYWEAQYDVQMLPNMFNSPHGWSGWRAYATYYAYLLTGEERWLRETYNAMGSFAHLINPHTGQLNWAFVVDPYLHVEQTCKPDTTCTAETPTFGNPHPRLYPTRRFVIGEQYVPMISDWQPVNTQDNDVHELFKCMEETVLTQAFVVERADGSYAGYNCRVEKHRKKLTVIPDEPQMNRLHCNLKSPVTLLFNGRSKTQDRPICDFVAFD